MEKTKIVTTKTEFKDDECGISLNDLIESLQKIKKELGNKDQIVFLNMLGDDILGNTKILSVEFDSATWALFINYKTKYGKK